MVYAVGLSLLTRMGIASSSLAYATSFIYSDRNGKAQKKEKGKDTSTTVNKTHSQE